MPGIWRGWQPHRPTCLIGSSMGAVIVSGEERGRRVPEARQADTATAFEASPGIQETTDAVRKALPFVSMPTTLPIGRPCQQ